MGPRPAHHFGQEMYCHSPPALPPRREFASSTFLTPTKPGKLAAKQEPIATVAVGPNAHDGFFLGSGSGLEESHALTVSETGAGFELMTFSGKRTIDCSVRGLGGKFGWVLYSCGIVGV